MPFDFGDNGREEYTRRALNMARGNSLFRALANSQSEGLLQSNRRYRIPNPTTTVRGEKRTRNSTTGAMSGYSLADSDDSALSWINVELLDNYSARSDIDKFDLRGGRISPVTLATIRQEISEDIRKWLDRRIITELIGATSSELVTTASTDNSNALYDISGKVIAGTAAQRNALAAQVLAWMTAGIRHLSTQDFRPGVGIGQTLSGVTVMPAVIHHIIQDYLLSEYGDTDQIVMEQLRTEASIFGGTYRGSYKSMPILVSNVPTVSRSLPIGGTATDVVERGLLPIAAYASTDAVTQANLLRCFMLVPNNSFDAGVVGYPAVVDAPDTGSPKHRTRVDVEMFCDVINGDNRGLLRQFTVRSQA